MMCPSLQPQHLWTKVTWTAQPYHSLLWSPSLKQVHLSLINRTLISFSVYLFFSFNKIFLSVSQAVEVSWLTQGAVSVPQTTLVPTPQTHIASGRSGSHSHTWFRSVFPIWRWRDRPPVCLTGWRFSSRSSRPQCSPGRSRWRQDENLNLAQFYYFKLLNCNVWFKPQSFGRSVKKWHKMALKICKYL